MASAAPLGLVCTKPKYRWFWVILSVLWAFLNPWPGSFPRSADRFTPKTNALIKVNRALIFFESPRSALSHSTPGGRDASNTGDVAAERDINPVSLAGQ
jgi:hypothetical protein